MRLIKFTADDMEKYKWEGQIYDLALEDIGEFI